MSHEEEKGKTKQVKGKIREAAGVLTDNKKMGPRANWRKPKAKQKKR
jgi:uncharacterized protein YjbJ (UPF0337 family)